MGIPSVMSMESISFMHNLLEEPPEKRLLIYMSMYFDIEKAILTSKMRDRLRSPTHHIGTLHIRRNHSLRLNNHHNIHRGHVREIQRMGYLQTCPLAFQSVSKASGTPRQRVGILQWRQDYPGFYLDECAVLPMRFRLHKVGSQHH